MMNGGMMDGGMGAMMGWMMGLGFIGWILVIGLLAAILVVLVKLLKRTGQTRDGYDPERHGGEQPRPR